MRTGRGTVDLVGQHDVGEDRARRKSEFVGLRIEQAAADGLALLDRNDDTRRLLFKDLDEFPDLKHRVGEQLIERSYGRVASSARRARPDSDSEAIAAVMVAALSGFRLHGFLLGHSPLEVSDDRFIAIWAKAFESLLEVETAGDANAS